MKFTEHRFSKRFPTVECTIFVVHEPQRIARYETTRGGTISYDYYRATGAAIILPTGMVYVGVSICSPEDQFVKATGRQKAIGRAYQEYRKGLGWADRGGHKFVYAEGPTFTQAIKACIEEHIQAKKEEMGLM